MGAVPRADTRCCTLALVRLATLFRLGFLLLAVGCGEGDRTTTALPSRPLVPDPVHAPPVLEATEQIVPGPGMPAEYVADNGISNNNLDVVRHDGRVYLAVRNGIFHYASPKTKMYVFSSLDQRTWELETKIEIGRDVREPRFLSHGGRLFLYFAALGTDRFDFEPHGMLVTERLAPGKWTIPRGFYRPEAPYIPWRVRTLGGRPYMLAYEHGEHEYDLSGIPITIEFLTTDDGLEWRPVDPAHRVVSSGGGSETDFAFDDRGDLYAVIRNEAGDDTGWGSKICFAPRDRLGEWTCNHDPRKYDSPWVFAYGGEIFLIGRRNVTEDGNFELRPGEPWSPTEALRNLALYSAQPKRCALWQVDRHSLTVRFIVDLPSRGDTCFASVLPDEANPKRFLVYNYSSPIDGPDVPWNKGQDGQTNIYRTPITLWLRAWLRPPPGVLVPASARAWY